MNPFRGFLFAALVIFAGVVSLRHVSSADLGIHIRTGERIVTERAIPSTDHFSFTADGNDWHINQWLAQILLYGVDETWGARGLVALRMLLVVGTFGLLVWGCTLGESRSELLGGALLVAALLASAPRILMRPFLFSVILLALVAVLFERYRRGNSRRLTILIPLFALWGTLHPGFLYGAGFLGCAVLGEWLRARVPVLRGAIPPLDAPRFRHLVIVSVLSIAAPILIAAATNPHGIESVLLPLGLMKSDFFLQIIDEYQRADPVRDRWFFVLLIVSGISLIIPHRKRLSMDGTELLLLCLFGIFAVKTVRVIFLFSLLAAPLAARNLSPLANRLLPPNRIPARWGTLVAALSILFFAWWWSGHDPLHGRGMDERNYPIAAFRFIEQNELPGEIFHPDRWGGAFTWYFWPERKNFIDGRLEVFGERFWKDTYFRVLGCGPAWEETLDLYGINTIILRIGSASGRDRIGARLLRHPDWALVYFDDQLMIHCRRSALAESGSPVIPLESLDPEMVSLPESIQEERDASEALALALGAFPSTRAFDLSWAILSERGEWAEIAGSSGLHRISRPADRIRFFRIRGEARFRIGDRAGARADWIEARGSSFAMEDLELLRALEDQSLDRLADRFGDRPDELFRMASLLLDGQEPSVASTIFRRAQLAGGGEGYYKNALAWSLLESGQNTEEALRLARETVHANPSDGYGRGTLARALRASGDPDGAEREMNEAIRLLVGVDFRAAATELSRLALFLEERGDDRLGDAMEAAIRALQIDSKTEYRPWLVRLLMERGGEDRLDGIMEEMAYNLGLGIHIEFAEEMGHGDIVEELKERFLFDYQGLPEGSEGRKY